MWHYSIIAKSVHLRKHTQDLGLKYAYWLLNPDEKRKWKIIYSKELAKWIKILISPGKQFIHLKGKTFGLNLAPWSSSVRSGTIIINSPCRSWGERALALCTVLIIFMHLHMEMEHCVETLKLFPLLISKPESECRTHCNWRSSHNPWVTARILFWHFSARPSVLFSSTLS